MQWKADKDSFILKIDRGENVKDSILKLASDEDISSGSILWGVGMIENMEIGYFNGREYEKETLAGPLEVVSFHGSIASNDPHLHIHLSVAGRSHKVVGGHLFSGEANPLLEVQVQKFRGFNMKRVYNEKSTLKELELD